MYKILCGLDLKALLQREHGDFGERNFNNRIVSVQMAATNFDAPIEIL